MELRLLITVINTIDHHAVKSFQLILPAIFFKLGIAFTMLVVVAIASVTNGVIGFLLLVVGLSNVLARFQEPPRRTSVPYYLPSVHHHAAIHHGWDRNDKRSEDKADTGMTQAYPPQPLQYLHPQVTASNSGDYAQTMQN
ncbi:hypothetical protein NQ317_003683 [Molorchus minor]|uniref:Uncharacterized protein n=1 Tax=Molorchus minor TaxID=1323400 RepID=A0ABQ9JNV5_9CUCU|nr:hypothetical protein NQ317_003683 [Molorchus minor]